MNTKTKLRVTVLDMQPIEPATGGGRLRLLGLYHALGEDIETRYVGTYDWPGPKGRRQMISPTLEELLVPLSAEHFTAAQELRDKVGGRVVIDSSFPALAHLSPEYAAAARSAAAEADVVIFSHPWVFPLVRGEIDRARQLLVYDAHNVEGLLRMELLDDGGGPGTSVVRDVVTLERELCDCAHVVLACSNEDRAAFNRLYDVPFERMRVFVNGTFTDRIAPPTVAQKRVARAKLGLGPAPVVFFIGSNYAPNAEAAAFIAQRLAPALPAAIFVVAGGVAESLQGAPKPFNLRLPGLVYQDERLTWLHAADVAINPMFSGSGTNIKMLDYMAAGLPVVTTAVGARGLEACHEAFTMAESSEFAAQLEMLVRAPERFGDLAQFGRRQAERRFSWEILSPRLGALLKNRHRNGTSRPFFSAIVRLDDCMNPERLFEALSNQTFPDVELIAVADNPSGRIAERYPNVQLVAAPEDDAAAGRNAGADVACGHMLAFVDGDCVPRPNWLETAHRTFQRTGAVVLEGRFDSNRPVYFPPENLFFQTEAFQMLGGFPDRGNERDWIWLAQSFGPVTSVDAPVAETREACGIITRRAPSCENVAWISSWGVPCGVAEYSRSLLNAMTEADPGLAVRILCDSRYVPTVSGPDNVIPCWKVGEAKIDLLLQTVKKQGPTQLVVQHHPGLLPWPALCTLLSRQTFPEMRFLLVLHNTSEIDGLAAHLQSRLIAALRGVDVLLVHTMADHDRLRVYGLSATLFPHGARLADIPRSARQLTPDSTVTIGCFGFFFPHKRIPLLIEAVARLRATWPNLRLRLVNSEFPREDSRFEVARSRALAIRVALYNRVEWFTEFLEEATVMRLLSEVDLIALPYADTPESASGALRVALASGVPVAVSGAAIFDEAEGAVTRLNGSTPDQLASSIDSILRDREFREELASSAQEWLYCRRWAKMGVGLLHHLDRGQSQGIGKTPSARDATAAAQAITDTISSARSAA